MFSRLLMLCLLAMIVLACATEEEAATAPSAETLFDDAYVQERFATLLRQLRKDHGSTSIQVARVRSADLIALCEAKGIHAQIEKSIWCSACKEGYCDELCLNRGAVWLAVDYME